MKITSTWPDFLDSIGPYLTKSDPLAALKQAGIGLGGEVGKAFGNAQSNPLFGAGALEALTAVYGPPPSLNLHVGRKAISRKAAHAGVLGNFSAVGAADLAILNQVIAELWTVKTIPHAVGIGAYLSLDDLRAACTGVPQDGSLGQFQLIAAPVTSANEAAPLSIHIDISFNLPVESDGPASLLGFLHVDQPLALEVATNTTTLQLTDAGLEAMTVHLEISGASFLQLQSEDKRAPLEAKISSALQFVLRYIFAVLQIPAQVGVSNTFPNSNVTISQIGAACIHKGATDYLIAGINVGAPADYPGTPALVAAQTPVAPNNIHAVSNEQFATDSLASIIQSGDLAAYANRIVARHVPVLHPPSIVVHSGSVSFDNELLYISADCAVEDACGFGKDLGFTATVSGRPSVDGGTLSISSSDVDMDVDDVDAVVCTILGALSGPLGLIFNEVVIAVVAAYNPAGKNLEFPSTDTSKPLPGSDKDFKIQLTAASPSPGMLTADATAGLAPDITRAFVHLQLTKDTPQPGTPVAGATVELLELDSPAPAGDDVKVPATGETERITGKFIIDDLRTYQALPDQSLGSGITNAGGYVRIVGPVRSAAGIFTDITTREDVVTGKILSTQTRTTLIQEFKPDFAVNVTAADGTVLAKRLLIALNNPDKHLGSLEQPFLVRLS